MLSRFCHRTSVPIQCSTYISSLNHQSKSQSTVPQATSTESPFRRPMKKPILTGRNSKTHGREIKELVPNPLAGRALPFGKRHVFENKLAEDLANGEYWSKFIDRYTHWTDFDLVERGWGNEDLYRIPCFKRPYDDVTMNNNIDFQFRISNLAMHVEMVRSIPHLKPLLREISGDFDGITRKWQDIISQVIDKKEKSFELRTTIIRNWNERIETDQMKHNELKKYNTGDNEEKRKIDLKKKISYATVKKFVDNKVEDHEWVKLIFVDAIGTKHYVYGMVGETLLQACRRYCIPIDGYCNAYDRGVIRIYGEGAWCAQCQMDIAPRYFHLIPAYDWREKLSHWRFRSITPTSRLGCCIWIRPEFDGMVVNIPPSLMMPYGRFED